MASTQEPVRFDTLVVGPTHFIDKLAYQHVEYKKRGRLIKYLLTDLSGMSGKKASQVSAYVEITPKSVPARLGAYLRVLIIDKPAFVELYDTGKITVAYAILAKLLGRKIVFFLRGMELWGRERGRRVSWFRHWGLRCSLKMADLVIAKELNIREDLRRADILPESRIKFLGNAVPVSETAPSVLASRPIDLIFLNSIKPFRNVPMMFQALKIVLDKYPKLKVVVAGFTQLNKNSFVVNSEEENKSLKILKDLGLQEKIDIRGFVDDGRDLLMQSKIFMLPADIVFPNFALLEAMSFGTVPVIGDGEGSQLIVKNEIDGLVSARNAEAFAAQILKLLENPALQETLSQRAREKIAKNFSIQRWAEDLLEARDQIKSA